LNYSIKYFPQFFMRKTFFLLLVTLPGFGLGLIAQTNFWNSRNAYLGQTLPGDTRHGARLFLGQALCPP
jgi:hypothetical protein